MCRVELLQGYISRYAFACYVLMPFGSRGILGPLTAVIQRLNALSLVAHTILGIGICASLKQDLFDTCEPFRNVLICNEEEQLGVASSRYTLDELVSYVVCMSLLAVREEIGEN